MSKLFLYADRRCKLVDKPSKATWKEIRYECQNQQAIIYDGDKIYHLKDNEMISFKGQRIYFRCRFPLWKMNGWKGKAVIGRGKECDIQIDSVHVSSRHCTLFLTKQGIVIEDLGSTNGTYVHGRRITETILQPGDGVLVANVEIVVFPDFLISYGLKKHEQIPEQPENRVLKKMKIHRVHQPLEFPEKIVEIELPRFDDREANTGLFQSLASSLMILMSGIATGLVLFFSGTSKEMMVPMLISNGMMGGSFLGFGLYNYRKNKQQNTKRIRWNETQYLSYLQEKEAEIWRYREESVRRFKALKEICCVQSEKTYGITHPLLIGEDKKPWITIRHAKIGYEHTTHPLALKVKALDQIQTETLLQPVFWWPGSQVYVQSGDSQFGLQLFLQFIWQAPSYDCKWIWIDRSLDLDRRLFLFPQCRLGQEKLWIRKKEDMTKLKDWIRHCKNVYVVSKEDWIDEYPEIDFSLCRISEKNGSETGKVVNHPVPVCDDIDQKLRQVLYTVRKEKENPLIQSLGMADGKEVGKNPSESVELCIPVGLDKEDAWIVFDLHENKHGPHGLIAGMTGSGKSEWLSAFLMQLVLRNSSRLLQYILIDFKGGAFGSHFYEFPHCAGM
ncbi:MAG: FHA domain-containing protein, partial [Erysipelotrichaceae bacterium]|nr:FHA domain-containing protein [Erysipelotrichaceae bacterium]